MAEITEEMIEAAARSVAEGGWSSIYELVSSLTESQFVEHFDYIVNEEEEWD